MSHITCHECGSNDHVAGYGMAAGPMGSYTICAGDDCNEVLELSPDVEGVPDDVAKKIREQHASWVALTNEKRAAKGLPLLTEDGTVTR